MSRGTRMLEEAFDAYGDENATIAAWAAKKAEAVQEGKWRWKTEHAHLTKAEGHVGLGGKMQIQLTDEIKNVQIDLDLLHHDTDKLTKIRKAQSDYDGTTCGWKQTIMGKMYMCTNMGNLDFAKTMQLSSVRCNWHIEVCSNPEHDPTVERCIRISNAEAKCLTCFEKSHAHEPKRNQRPQKFAQVKIPGVHTSDFDRMKNAAKLEIGASKYEDKIEVFTKDSTCTWEKRNPKTNRRYICSNVVIPHPETHAYLRHCGYHAITCVRSSNQKKGLSCPPIAKPNKYGLCRNHYLAHKNEQKSRAKMESEEMDTADTIFDAPGVIKACKRTTLQERPKAHILAPSHPPPVIRPLLTKTTTWWDTFLAWDHPVVQYVESSLWWLEHHRKRKRFVLRIQKTFRGRRDRRRVKHMRNELRALERLKAIRVIQRFVRACNGRKKFLRELEAVTWAVPFIQRVFRGALARRLCRQLRAAACIKRVYRIYRMKRVAWAKRNQVKQLQKFQAAAMNDYFDVMASATVFQRKRAIQLLQRRVRWWRAQRLAWQAEEEELKRIHFAARVIQRAWRWRFKRDLIQKRYEAAFTIQRRMRGYLTRQLWSTDPGIEFHIVHTNQKTKFNYVKGFISWHGEHSYSIVRKRIRFHFAATVIQKVFRGYMGRLLATAAWAEMNKRWEWALGDNYDKAKHSYLLPSFSYSAYRELHMRIPGKLPPDRSGYRYEYQDILDLMEDKQALRLPSESAIALRIKRMADAKKAALLAEEQQKAEEEAERKAKAEVKRLKERTTAQILAERKCWAYSVEKVMSSAMKKEIQDSFDAPKKFKGMSDIEARLPIGAQVFLQMPGGRQIKGKITRALGNNQFDVEFNKKFLTKSGVPMYREDRVPLERIQTHLKDTRWTATKGSAGGVMQDAILQIEHDILSSRLRHERHADKGREVFHDVSEDTKSIQATVPRPCNDEEEIDFYISILRTLRSTSPDVTHDRRDLVAYVFTNMYMFEKYWLRIVHDVKKGTFSVCPDDHSSLDKYVFADPSRAKRIEDIVASLGFKYDPSANRRPPKIKPWQINKVEQDLGKAQVQLDGMLAVPLHEQNINQVRNEMTGVVAVPMLSSTSSSSQTSLRRHSTGEAMQPFTHREREERKERGENGAREKGRDERSLPMSADSSQDVQNLMRELKALPREPWRDKILHVATRHTRSYVCGHPGCGKAFTEYDGAWLHRKRDHAHKDRLSFGDPEVDQYHQKFWPSQSPWRDDTNGRLSASGIVGFFKCKMPGCSEDFGLREELHKHLREVHPESTLKKEQVNPSIMVLDQQTFVKDFASTFPRTCLVKQLPTCLLHEEFQELCDVCQAQRNSPVMPCYSFKVVGIHVSDTNWCIFKSLETFCPAIEHPLFEYYSSSAPLDTVTMEGKAKQRKKGVCINDRFIFCKVLSMCRDVHLRDWMAVLFYQTPLQFKQELLYQKNQMMNLNKQLKRNMKKVEDEDQAVCTSSDPALSCSVKTDLNTETERLKSPNQGIGIGPQPMIRPLNLSHAFKKRFQRCEQNQMFLKCLERQGYDANYEYILLDDEVHYIEMTSVVGYGHVRECSRSMFYRKYLKRDEALTPPDQLEDEEELNVNIAERFCRITHRKILETNQQK